MSGGNAERLAFVAWLRGPAERPFTSKRYRALCRAFRGLGAEPWKQKQITKYLRQQVAAGFRWTRRVPGTGRRETQQKVYGDSKLNRELDRVGKSYEVVRWVGFETREAMPRPPRARRAPSGRRNAWVCALSEARAAMLSEGLAPGGPPVRKGSELHARALLLLKNNKAPDEDQGTTKP